MCYGFIKQKIDSKGFRIDFFGAVIASCRAVVPADETDRFSLLSFFTKKGFSLDGQFRFQPGPGITDSTAVSYTHLTLPTIYSV